MKMTRCPWCPDDDPEYVRYHDEEWGVPSHDDRHLFEMLILEGAQAGLSWRTILRKREHYRKVFHNFDIRKIARMKDPDVERLMQDPGIVRNRAKIESTLLNARAALDLIAEEGSLDQFLWQFVGHRTRQNRFRSMSEVPAKTAESDAMSRALKKRGFKFVGTTICYAFMQAVGMVNDHLVTCPRWKALAD